MSPNAVLAYCIAELQRKPAELPETGVQGRTIRSFEAGGLRCFFSQLNSRHPEERAAEDVRSFGRVLQYMFAQFAILPFRFPTILSSEAELQDFVSSRCGRFREALDRFRDNVQMDLRVTFESRAEMETKARSGKAYLERQRGRYQQLVAAIQDVREASGQFTEQWVQRESSSGIRAFALIKRESLDRFVEHISNAEIPERISVRVTGPWPPSEFVEDGNE